MADTYVIPGPGRQEDPCDFEASLGYMVSSETGWAKSETLPKTKPEEACEKEEKKLEAKVGPRVAESPWPCALCCTSWGL